MNISPNQPIPVSYSVLPYDSTTYFVQSVLRDTATNKVIQTLSLIQTPGVTYRYTGSFNPVSDISGLGRYVDIVTIAYTDSGHTTPSQNYGPQQNNYVVLQALLPNVGVGGAGYGADIDYKKLAELVVKRINAKKPKEKEPVKQERIEYARIERTMSESANHILEVMEAHMKPVEAALSDIREDVRGSSSNAAEAILGRMTSLEDRVMQYLEENNPDLETLRSDLIGTVENIIMEMSKMNQSSVEEMKEAVSGVSDDVQKKLDDSISTKPVQLVLSTSPTVASPQPAPFRHTVDTVKGLL